jgi:hypothetical protein
MSEAVPNIMHPVDSRDIDALFGTTSKGSSSLLQYVEKPELIKVKNSSFINYEKSEKTAPL